MQYIEYKNIFVCIRLIKNIIFVGNGMLWKKYALEKKGEATGYRTQGLLLAAHEDQPLRYSRDFSHSAALYSLVDLFARRTARDWQLTWRGAAI
jgi:hypothetical protein